MYDNPRPVKRIKPSGEASQRVWLVFGGKTGWVGQKIVSLLKNGDEKVHVASARLEDRQGILKDIEQCKPTHVINAAGLTGRPNVDWCENHKQDTVRVNVMGTLNLIDACWQHGIHVTNCATGCIYHYDDRIVQGSGDGFKETDPPNFTGSFYSKTKAIVEDLVNSAGYDNVLTLRFRMPVSDDLHHRSLVTKLVNYDKLVNIPNSMTILYDMLPLLVGLAKHGKIGTFNFTNPGSISHNEVMSLYKEFIDPEKEWTNFTLEEHNEVVIAKRSNTELDGTKLIQACKEIGLEVLDIRTAFRACFERMKANLSQ